MKTSNNAFIVFLATTITLSGLLLNSLTTQATSGAVDFFATSGVDTTTGTSKSFTSTDLAHLQTIDGNRVRSDSNWPSSDTYNETDYLEFDFSPNIPANAVISSVTVTNNYRRDHVLTGLKLEVWDGNNFNHTETLTYPSADNTDVTDTKDISSYITTATQVNNLKIRFLAYRTTSGSTKTSHDQTKVSVIYTVPTATPSDTPTPSDTATPTPTPSSSNTPTPTPTETVTPTPSNSATPTPTPSDTATPTPTLSGSTTPTPTPSDSSTPTPTPSETTTPTPTPTDTGTPTPTPTETATPIPEVSLPPLGAPIASPSSGTYENDQLVNLVASGSDSIYFTYNGEDPNCTSGNAYVGPIHINLSSVVLKAIACSTNNRSTISTYIYQILHPSNRASSGGADGNSDNSTSSGSPGSSTGSDTGSSSTGTGSGNNGGGSSNNNGSSTSSETSSSSSTGSSSNSGTVSPTPTPSGTPGGTSTTTPEPAEPNQNSTNPGNSETPLGSTPTPAPIVVAQSRPSPTSTPEITPTPSESPATGNNNSQLLASLGNLSHHLLGIGIGLGLLALLALLLSLGK